MCIHIYIFEASSAYLVEAGLELLLLFLNFLFYFNLFFVCAYLWMGVCHIVEVRDNLQESVFSFGCVGPGNPTWVFRHGNRHLYL